VLTPDYLFFLAFYLVGMVIRHGYERLKKSDRVDTRNKVVFASVFAAMCMMCGPDGSRCARLIRFLSHFRPGCAGSALVLSSWDLYSLLDLSFN
jgi:hypothetical protein